MAQLTRDEFVAELTLRGHGRFGDESLQRYLDWALQDVYRLGKFDSVVDVDQPGAVVAGDALVAFDDIADDGAPTVHSINAAYVTNLAGAIVTLTEASRERFWKDLYPNSLASAAVQTRDLPQEYYVHGESLYLWPAADQSYVLNFHYTSRADTFAGGDDTSGLPERFDTAILAAAEMQCTKRARDTQGYVIAQAEYERLIALEIGNENRQFTEEAPRIGRYEH